MENNQHDANIKQLSCDKSILPYKKPQLYFGTFINQVKIWLFVVFGLAGLEHYIKNGLKKKKNSTWAYP